MRVNKYRSKELHRENSQKPAKKSPPLYYRLNYVLSLKVPFKYRNPANNYINVKNGRCIFYA